MSEMGYPVQERASVADDYREVSAAQDAAVLDNAKRQQILEGARRIFLKDGYDGASIGDIVRAAGVSKGTLYAYFPSKEKLFETLIFEDRRKQAEVLFTLDESDTDMRQVLRKLGLSFVAMLILPETLAFFRTVVGAAAKFPELGHVFYAAGPCYGAERLASYFERMSAKGLLNTPDPTLAARQYLDLCKAGIHLRMLLGHAERPPEAEIVKNVDSAVKLFLAAYGTNQHHR